MGHVIRVSFSRDKKTRAVMPAGHQCQIYILPCVRYEHWDTPPKTTAAVKKSRKRRARAR